MTAKDRDGIRASLELAPSADGGRYLLRLYVTGMTSRSERAIRNLQGICDEHLKGKYDLEVIDIYQQPVLAKGEQIIAAPTLIKKLPLPMRRIIGDMSNRERVLVGLDLRSNSKQNGGISGDDDNSR
jgi:circadian clock protein KaiB